MKSQIRTLLALASALAATAASAHISVSGTPIAGTTFEANFTVSHGCNGADTYRVKIRIPEGVTSVRPIDSAFGKAVVEKDAVTGQVTAVVWTRSGDVLPEDLNYYRFTLRAKLPNKPFTTVYFPTTQTCRTTTGTESVTEWSGTSGEHNHDSDGGTTVTENPAPSMYLYPPRMPGWNKYTVNEHVHDLTVFMDALIVWSGNKAYSFNPNTRALIEKEPNTEILSEIHPGMEIWVKY
ncbi:DUF1775 domain-containing protein [Myxococcaceae bacterium GXIMD 01537]